MGQGALAHLRNHQYHHHHDHDCDPEDVDENTTLLDQARRESQNVRKKSSFARTVDQSDPTRVNGSGVQGAFREVDYGQTSPSNGNVVDACSANPRQELPVYKTIHGIRRDVVRAIGMLHHS